MDTGSAECRGDVLVSSAAVTKHHRPGALKQQVLISHSSGGWESQGQGASRSIWKSRGEMERLAVPRRRNGVRSHESKPQQLRHPGWRGQISRVLKAVKRGET